jgi:O-antigen/teichoic acid export membrane protein
MNLEAVIKSYRKFIVTGSPLVISQILNSLIAFVSAILLGHFLPKEVFGEYKYLLSLFTIFSYFYLSGYSTVIVREIANKNFGSYLTISKKVIYSSLCGTLLAFVGAVYYFVNDNISLSLSLIIISFFIPLNNYFNLYSAFLAGQQNFKAVSISQTSINFACAIVLVIASLFAVTPNILLFLYYLTFVISCYLASRFYIRTQIRKIEKRSEETLINKKYAINLSIMNIANVAGQQIDKLIVFHFLGPVQLAILFFAESLPMQVKNLQKVLFSVLIPKFAKDDRNITSLKTQVVLLTMIMSLVIVIYILIAPFAFKILFPKYTDSVFISQVYSVSLLFSPTAYLLGNYFIARAHTKKLYIMTFSFAVLSIVFNYIFIGLYGIIGASYAAIATNFIYILILLFLYRRLIISKSIEQ